MRPSLAFYRRFLSSSPAAATPVPRLKLYTGGPACSLCIDLKEELLALQHTQPCASSSSDSPPRKAFELETYDIRKDTADGPSEAAERKQWRRLYKYDIPVLHLVRPGLVSTAAGVKAAEEGETPSLPGPQAQADEVEIFRHRLDRQKLEAALAAEQARLEHLL